ncbi:MAG: hypothetical protein WC314_16465 [Vulcanimicrobiota bacterium]
MDIDDETGHMSVIEGPQGLITGVDASLSRGAWENRSYPIEDPERPDVDITGTIQEKQAEALEHSLFTKPGFTGLCAWWAGTDSLSSLGELPPEALAEPDLNLSAHPARVSDTICFP